MRSDPEWQQLCMNVFDFFQFVYSEIYGGDALVNPHLLRDDSGLLPGKKASGARASTHSSLEELRSEIRLRRQLLSFPFDTFSSTLQNDAAAWNLEEVVQYREQLRQQLHILLQIEKSVLWRRRQPGDEQDKTDGSVGTASRGGARHAAAVGDARRWGSKDSLRGQQSDSSRSGRGPGSDSNLASRRRPKTTRGMQRSSPQKAEGEGDAQLGVGRSLHLAPDNPLLSISSLRGMLSSAPRSDRGGPRGLSGDSGAIQQTSTAEASDDSLRTLRFSAELAAKASQKDRADGGAAEEEEKEDDLPFQGFQEFLRENRLKQRRREMLNHLHRMRGVMEEELAEEEKRIQIVLEFLYRLDIPSYGGYVHYFEALVAFSLHGFRLSIGHEYPDIPQPASLQKGEDQILNLANLETWLEKQRLTGAGRNDLFRGNRIHGEFTSDEASSGRGACIACPLGLGVV